MITGYQPHLFCCIVCFVIIEWWWLLNGRAGCWAPLGVCLSQERWMLLTWYWVFSHHGGRLAKLFGSLQLEGGLAMLFHFMLLWVNHPLIMKLLLKDLRALGGSGQSGGSVGLGSSSGSGCLAPAAAGLQWRRLPLAQCSSNASGLWRNRHPPSIPPLGGTERPVTWQGPAQCPWLVPQPVAAPQPGPLWAAEAADGKEKAAPVMLLGVPQDTGHSSNRCLLKQLCFNDWYLHGRWLTFLSWALHNTVPSSAPGASASPAPALWDGDGLLPCFCVITYRPLCLWFTQLQGLKMFFKLLVQLGQLEQRRWCMFFPTKMVLSATEAAWLISAILCAMTFNLQDLNMPLNCV